MRWQAPESLLLLRALTVGDVGVLVVDKMVSVVEKTVSVGETTKQNSMKFKSRPSLSSRLIGGWGMDVTADEKAGGKKDRKKHESATRRSNWLNEGNLLV